MCTDRPAYIFSPHTHDMYYALCTCECATPSQVDFSSSNMGGGLVESGCLQEEVRLCVSPELLVSVMVMDHMEANEAVIITVSLCGVGGGYVC